MLDQTSAEGVRRIGVGIPTASRPDLLRTALQSVANQSRLDLISEILVSENGGDSRSFNVCQEFPNLRIRYIAQFPQLDPYSHFYRVTQELKAEFVALLGDDDMWGRHHLEDALKSLDANPETIGYVSQTVIVRNEARQIHSGYTILLPSLQGRPSQQFAHFWIWNASDLLMDSLVRTPHNLWALVAKRDKLLTAMDFFKTGDLGLDADRLMWWRLARLGSILIGREVGLFYRVHDQSACGLLEKANPEFHFQKSFDYTLQMISEAEAEGIDWKNRWLTQWSCLSEKDQKRLWTSALPGAKHALCFSLGTSFNQPKKTRETLWKYIIKLAAPPIIIKTLKRIRAFRSNSLSTNFIL